MRRQFQQFEPQGSELNAMLRTGSRAYGIALCDYHAKRTDGDTRAAHLAMANHLRGQG